MANNNTEYPSLANRQTSISNDKKNTLGNTSDGFG